MKKQISIVVIMLFTAGLLTQFTNCAESLPDNLNQTSAASVSPTPSPTVIVLSIPQPTLLVNQISQLMVNGGTGPYTYAAPVGTVSVSATGLVTALAVGTTIIEVTDQNGVKANISLSVVASVSGSGASCTTAFGQSVPHGGQVNVYTAATVKCPATCTPRLMTCNNGDLVGPIAAATGVSGSCSVSACVYKLVAQSACPYSGGPLSRVAIPATCAASEHGRYMCALDAGNSYFGDWQCSSP